MNNTELKIFSNNEFGNIRAMMINNEPYFVGKDVATILGYTNPSKAIADHVDSEDKLNNETLSSLGQRGGWLINESGLYSLILSSKLPNAKKFKHWVTAEVLPSIRKHGAYMTENTIQRALESPDFLIELATKLKAEQEQRKRLEEENNKMKPKALFAESVQASQTTILIGELAKILRGNGVNIGAKRLFEWMRKQGYLINRKGSDWNMPTQRAMDLGLFKIKETVVTHASGNTTINKTTKVTGKGQVYFVNKLTKEYA